MKVFYMGRRLDGKFDSFKMKMHRLGRFLKILFAAIGLIMLSGALGAFFFSTSKVTVTTQTVIAPAPVLSRIADCESGNGKPGTATHYGKSGQVLMIANPNATVDVGKYQINLYYWGAKATELGLDLTKEEDNRQMAEYIYSNNGTGDWSASAHCWKR